MINLDGSRSIGLQTSKGRDVANTQDLEIPLHRRAQAETLIRQQLGIEFAQVDRRRDATATYNCHGMTFACRRTGIYDLAAVQLILDDDDYAKVRDTDVMPGDVVLYFEADPGGLIHSGIVVEVRRVGKAVVPIVISKWGAAGEYVHPVAVCPYPQTKRIQFYREGQNGRRS